MVTAFSETLTREEFERRLLVRFHLFVETLQSYYHEHAEDFGIPPGNTAGWSNETRIALIRTLAEESLRFSACILPAALDAVYEENRPDRDLDA